VRRRTRAASPVYRPARRLRIEGDAPGLLERFIFASRAWALSSGHLRSSHPGTMGDLIGRPSHQVGLWTGRVRITSSWGWSLSRVDTRHRPEGLAPGRIAQARSSGRAIQRRRRRASLLRETPWKVRPPRTRAADRRIEWTDQRLDGSGQLSALGAHCRRPHTRDCAPGPWSTAAFENWLNQDPAAQLRCAPGLAEHTNCHRSAVETCRQILRAGRVSTAGGGRGAGRVAHLARGPQRMRGPSWWGDQGWPSSTPRWGTRNRSSGCSSRKHSGSTSLGANRLLLPGLALMEWPATWVDQGIMSICTSYPTWGRPDLGVVSFRFTRLAVYGRAQCAEISAAPHHPSTDAPAVGLRPGGSHHLLN